MNLEEMKNLSPDKQAELFSKLKGIRHQSKQVVYSAMYGVTPAGLVRNTGMSMANAEKLHATFWKINWSVKAAADNMTVKTCDGSKWMFNPVSKLWYSLRHDKDRWSTLNQGTGTYAFDVWIKHILKRRYQLTANIHDEVVLHIKEGNREKCTKLLRDAMKDCNQELNLNRELDCDIQFGQAYSEIH